jgi:hypothetical protein
MLGATSAYSFLESSLEGLELDAVALLSILTYDGEDVFTIYEVPQ